MRNNPGDKPDGECLARISKRTLLVKVCALVAYYCVRYMPAIAIIRDFVHVNDCCLLSAILMP